MSPASHTPCSAWLKDGNGPASVNGPKFENSGGTGEISPGDPVGIERAGSDSSARTGVDGRGTLVGSAGVDGRGILLANVGVTGRLVVNCVKGE